MSVPSKSNSASFSEADLGRGTDISDEAGCLLVSEREHG